MTTRAVIDTFPTCRVMVVGDVILDEYLWGNVRRICPEAPVPVVEEIRRSNVPGGMANVAVNIASLGARAVVAGVTGDDPQSQVLRELITRHGLDTSGLLTDPNRPTTLKTRIMAHNQQVVRVDREDSLPISNNIEQDLLQWICEWLPTVGCCVISDYAKGVLTPTLTAAIISAARKLDLPIVVDPKGTDYRRYRGASVITPNFHEACLALTNEHYLPTKLLAVGGGLLNLLPGTSVLVTRGPDGITLFREGHDSLSIPSAARQVFDVTGAGDTLIATLAVAIAAGCPLEIAASVANFAAGLVVGKIGTATISHTELWTAAGSEGLTPEPRVATAS